MNRLLQTTVSDPSLRYATEGAPVTKSPAAAPSRVLRNTYALLSLTLLFSAGVAATSVLLRLPAPGLLLTLAGYFALLFAVFKLKDSAWSLLAVFALTGFMGYTLGPLITRTLAAPGGANAVVLALAATGAVFVGLSAYARISRRDFGFLGSFLFAGMIVALVAGLAATLLQLGTLAVVVSAGVALLSAGLILFETDRIVRGGETNYVLATVALYVSVFNLFVSLLHLLGLGGSDE
jgi:modulator of FtsH protease